VKKSGRGHTLILKLLWLFDLESLINEEKRRGEERRGEKRREEERRGEERRGEERRGERIGRILVITLAFWFWYNSLFLEK
jgi:hypothetical protein